MRRVIQLVGSLLDGLEIELTHPATTFVVMTNVETGRHYRYGMTPDGRWVFTGIVDEQDPTIRATLGRKDQAAQVAGPSAERRGEAHCEGG